MAGLVHAVLHLRVAEAGSDCEFFITTLVLTWCEVSANAISASLAHSVPPASASAFTQSVMNSVMHWSTAVSTKVTRNHGPCAKERAHG